MASADDYAAWIVKNADKRGTPEFQTVAAAYRDLQSGGESARQQRADADRAQYDPTVGMSTADKLLSMMGSGMVSTLRAVGGGSLAEKFGFPATAEEAGQIDRPLQAASGTGGKVAKVLGQAAPSLLAVPVAPASALGIIGTSAALGAATTEGDLGDRAIGAGAGALGGAVGAAVPGAFRLAKGVYRGLTEPLTQAGQQRIAGRTIQQFTTDPAAMATANGAPTITGALPTLAEATRDPGIATLQRAISTMDPEAAAAFAARGQVNNASRLRTLGDIADTGAPARATRSGAAKASYGAAEQAGIDPALAQSMRPQIEALLSRPSIRAAQADAQALAAEQGLNIGDNTSIQGLQFLKKALDDQIGKAVPGSNQLRALTQTARDLNLTLEQLSPAYTKANAEFAQNSIPVNQADVAQRLLEKATNAIRDFSGDRTLQAGKFASSLNDEAKLLKDATGQRQFKELADLMTPAQMERIGGVRSELETLANLGAAANGAGSQTAKMLSSQNMIRQIADPLGLPEGFMSNMVTHNLQRIPNFVGYKAADPLIQKELAAALLDPSKALDFLARAQKADIRLPDSQLQKLLKRAAPALANTGVSRGANRAD